jgi:hypothetical protein
VQRLHNLHCATCATGLLPHAQLQLAPTKAPSRSLPRLRHRAHEDTQVSPWGYAAVLPTWYYSLERRAKNRGALRNAKVLGGVAAFGNSVRCLLRCPAQEREQNEQYDREPHQDLPRWTSAQGFDIGL